MESGKREYHSRWGWEYLTFPSFAGIAAESKGGGFGAGGRCSEKPWAREKDHKYTKKKGGEKEGKENLKKG